MIMSSLTPFGMPHDNVIVDLQDAPNKNVIVDTYDVLHADVIIDPFVCLASPIS